MAANRSRAVRAAPGAIPAKAAPQKVRRTRPAESAARTVHLERWRENLDREWAQLRAEQAALEGERASIRLLVEELRAKLASESRVTDRFMRELPRYRQGRSSAS